MLYTALQFEPLDLGALHAELLTAAAGGVATFVGVTRQEGQPATVALHYAAYAPMAERMLAALLRQAAAQWPVKRAIVVHRLGRVPAGQPSVFVGVATPHRGDAFAACRYLIDTLKTEVPIWKCEHFEDDTHRWLGEQVASNPTL